MVLKGSFCRMQSSTTDKKGLNVSDFLRAFLVDKSLGDTSDIISDSSGVGTSTSDTTNPSITLPGTTVVCIESYNSGLPGHLSITQGDILEGLWHFKWCCYAQLTCCLTVTCFLVQ